MSPRKTLWASVTLTGVLLGVLAALLLTRAGVSAPSPAAEPPATAEPPEPPPSSAAVVPTPEPAPDRGPEVRALLEAVMREHPGRWSLCWMPLPAGEPVLASSDAEPMVSASLIKLYVMGAVYERLERGGLEHDAVLPLLRDMITVSDNASANELIRLLGGGEDAAGMAAVNDWCAGEGYAATRLNRLMLEDNGLQNYSSAADCAAFLAAVYRGECVSEAASREMLAFLLDQQVNDRLPALLPAGTPVAHKTGDLSGLCCADVGIVYGPAGDYVLCVICNDPPYDWSTRDAVAALSGQIFDLLNGGEA